MPGLDQLDDLHGYLERRVDFSVDWFRCGHDQAPSRLLADWEAVTGGQHIMRHGVKTMTFAGQRS